MTHTNHQFDEAKLDELLKKYGEAEARVGLESRVLARLATEQTTTRIWHWRLAVATLALCVIAGAIFLARHSGTRHQTVTNQMPAVNITQPKPSITTSSSKNRAAKPSVLRPANTLIAKEPKLDQFPSATPLTEQEELLARYIQERQHEAVMVARAQAELENKEFLPTTKEPISIDEKFDTQQ